MAADRVSVCFKRITISKNAALWGSNDWYFTASVDGSQVGDPNMAVTVRDNTYFDFAAETWTAVVDVTNRKLGDIVAITFQARDSATPGKGSVGEVKINLRCPCKKRHELDLAATEVRSNLTTKSHYQLEVIIAPLASGTGTGAGQPGALFVSRQVDGSNAFCTINGDTVTPRVEICPVVPVPAENRLPKRPPKGVGADDGEDSDASKKVELKDDTALNALPNPAVIPVLDKNDPDLLTKAARIAITYTAPKNLDTSHLTWHVKEGSVAFIGATAGKTEVLAYGTSNGQSDSQALIEVRWDGNAKCVLAIFRAWVGGIKVIPYRATIFNSATTALRITPNHVPKQIHKANVLLWQVGLQLVPDTYTGRGNGARITAQPAVFSCATDDDNIVAINYEVPVLVTLLNCRPGGFNIAYVKSTKTAGVSGVATDRPGLSGSDETLNCCPSTSWVQPSGIKPDAAEGDVTMHTIAKSATRGSLDEDKTAVSKRGFSSQFWNHLYGLVVCDYTDPDDADWGVNIAHEAAHVLGLAHRGNGGNPASRRSVDGVDAPETHAPGAAMIGYPYIENVMTYARNTPLDFDMIQAAVMRRHPLTKNITYQGDNAYVVRDGKKVPHFSQGDARWADRILNVNFSIRAAGCAISSVAMILKYYGRSKVTPLTLDQYLDEHHGYAANRDAVIWAVALQHEAAGHTALIYGDGTNEIKVTDPAEMDVILSRRLLDNKPTLAHVAYTKNGIASGNHFVVIVGQTPDGHWIMNDPATRLGDGGSDPSRDNILKNPLIADTKNATTTRGGGGYNLVSLHIIEPK